MTLYGDADQDRRDALRGGPDIVKSIYSISIEIGFCDKLAMPKDDNTFQVVVRVFSQILKHGS